MSKKGVNEQIRIDVLLSNIKKRFNLSSEEIIGLFKEEKEEKEEIKIPISIFHEKLGMLESISLYLRDELRLSFRQIAELLKRDYKTIWTSYSKAKKKLKNG